MDHALKVVGITGAAGFFGWHLKCRLFALGQKFITADRSTFASEANLDAFLEESDVVIHLAGVNRASTDSDVVRGNISLAEALVSSRERVGCHASYVFANSIKAVEPGPYGESKARAAEILKEDALRSGGNFTDILFPHLYGEFGLPFYNSGVTTFAHQLVLGEKSVVNEGQLQLLHVQDAAQTIVDAIAEASGVTQLVPAGREISVPDVYKVLQRLADYATTGTVPVMHDDSFELRLFNTIRSQMWPDSYPMPITRHSDSRGSFFEVVRAWGQGQTSISTTEPGVVRGEHFHFDKVERFAVISGSAIVRVRRIFTDELLEFSVSGDEPCFIDMPPLCTHDITNTGKTQLITLFWSHDHFDPKRSDTYPLPVTGVNLPA